MIGGGKNDYYFIEQELKNSNKLILRGEELNVPSSIEELAQNYNLIESKILEVEFR